MSPTQNIYKMTCATVQNGRLFLNCKKKNVISLICPLVKIFVINWLNLILLLLFYNLWDTDEMLIPFKAWAEFPYRPPPNLKICGDRFVNCTLLTPRGQGLGFKHPFLCIYLFSEHSWNEHRDLNKSFWFTIAWCGFYWNVLKGASTDCWTLGGCFSESHHPNVLFATCHFQNAEVQDLLPNYLSLS